MMLFSVICFLFISYGAVHAQQVDERLLTKYSQSDLTSMIENNPDEYKMLAYALDNAIYVAPYSNIKGHTLETIVVDSEALPTFADLQLDIKPENQYFKIQGEEKILVIKSTWVLNHEMTKK